MTTQDKKLFAEVLEAIQALTGIASSTDEVRATAHHNVRVAIEKARRLMEGEAK